MGGGSAAAWMNQDEVTSRVAARRSQSSRQPRLGERRGRQQGFAGGHGARHHGTKQDLVSIEARLSTLERIDRPIVEKPGCLAARRCGRPVAQRRPGKACEGPTLQQSMEVDGDFESAFSQPDDKIAKSGTEAEGIALSKQFHQPGAGKDQRLIHEP
jgi:hypothetical protein